jgi:putative heme-binding domain-containing protein
MHALWVLEQLGRLDEALLTASLQDEDAGVCKNALRIAALQKDNAREDARKAVQARLQDSDPRVRLEALVALASMPPTAETARAIVALWPSLEDRYEQSAALGVVAGSPLLFIEVALAGGSAEPTQNFIRHATRSLAQSGDATQAARLVALLAKAPAGAARLQQASLESLAAGLKADVAPAWTPPLQAAFGTLLRSVDPAVQGSALPLVARWDKTGSMTAEIKPIVARLSRQLADPDQPDDVRAQVAANLIGVRQFDTGILPGVGRLLGGASSVALQQRVIESLGAIADAAAGAQLVGAFGRLSPALQDAAFAQIVKRPDWSAALLKALEGGELNWRQIGPASVHRLRTHGDKTVARRAAEVFDALRGPEAKEKEKLVAGLLPEVGKPGNLENGRKLYDQNCGVCHPFKNTGRNLAPDLTGMGVHGAHDLLVHILDPNRVVEANYVAVDIETKNDETFNGIVAGENRSAVKLRNATGDLEVRTADIRSRRSTGRSLMPEGFEALGAEGLRDLVAYISADDQRFRILDVSAAFTADSTGGIYASQESRRETLAFKKFGLVKAGEVPFDVTHPSKTVSGKNLIVLKGRNGITRDYPQKVEVTVPPLKAGRLHILGNVGGWAWPFGGEDTKGLPVAKFTATHADGSTQAWTLTNGVHVVDYINPSHECPGSKKVEGIVQGTQVRLYTQPLRNASPLTRLTIESFHNAVAPTFVAVTAELLDGNHP